MPDNKVTRFISQRPNSIAYILIVIVFAISLFGLSWEAKRRDESDAREAAERREEICEGIEHQQEIIDELLEVVLLPSGVGAVNATDIPSFFDLSPETQRFVVDLLRAIDEDPGPSLRQRLRQFREERLSIPACIPQDT